MADRYYFCMFNNEALCKVSFLVLELGGIAMSPPPEKKILKPGKTMSPSFGVVPIILDDKMV